MRRAVAGPVVVADLAAAVVQAVEVAPRAAVVLPAAKAVVEVAPVVAAVRAVVAKAVAVVVDAHPVAVVVDKAVEAVGEDHPVAVDKAGVAGANPVVGVDPAVVAAGWEEAVVVAVRLEVGAAAEPVNSSQSSGASRICGAPFFC